MKKHPIRREYPMREVYTFTRYAQDEDSFVVEYVECGACGLSNNVPTVGIFEECALALVRRAVFVRARPG